MSFITNNDNVINTHPTARSALEAAAMNSSTLIYEPFHRCCRNSDNLNLSCQLPDAADYQSRRNLRRSGGHAKCDASWPAARGLRFGSPSIASVASRECTRRKVAQHRSSPWRRSRLRCRVPARKLNLTSRELAQLFLFAYLGRLDEFVQPLLSLCRRDRLR